MAASYGPRGSQVTVVQWNAPDGTWNVEVFAASGKGRRSAHVTADDKRKLLMFEGIPEHEINVHTVTVQ